MSSPASVDILPTYTRILNATLVSSHTGREPRMDCAVNVHVLYVRSAVWLVIEFPHRRAWDIPYPSTTLGDMTALVFQLPSSFQFTHHPGNRACRWTTASSQEYRFSLVFFRDWEYLTLCNTVPQYIARMTSYGYGHTVDTHGAILLPRSMATLDDVDLRRHVETLKALFNLQGLCDLGATTDPWRFVSRLTEERARHYSTELRQDLAFKLPMDVDNWPRFLSERARELTGTTELVRVYLQYYRRLLRALGRLNRNMSERKAHVWYQVLIMSEQMDDLLDADWSNRMQRARIDMSNVSQRLFHDVLADPGLQQFLSQYSLADLDHEEKRGIQASRLVDHVDISSLQRKLPISDIEFLIQSLSILLKVMELNDTLVLPLVLPRRDRAVRSLADEMDHDEENGIWLWYKSIVIIGCLLLVWGLM
ncbi:hypothetical protein C8Q76DRAFT_688620 [Earliella scabrosa]|nr:hypothetical protein C8Q76DRAFT_688620 [Earliella scabrosa]